MKIKELINLMSSQNTELLTDGNSFYKLFPSKDGIILAKKSYGSTKFETVDNIVKSNNVSLEFRPVKENDIKKHENILRKNKTTLNY